MAMAHDGEFFDGSPFVLTATPRVGQCWAGRPEVLKRIKRVLRTLSSRSDSTLDLLWANFGSGKSHALYHIGHLLSLSAPNSISAFIEIPEQVRHFIDLYRRIIPALPLGRIAPLIADSRCAHSDLQRAAGVIVHGNAVERQIAVEWLSAGHVHLRELKTYTGISARLETDIQATDALSGVISALGQSDARLVLLMDEFQRLGVLPERARAAVLSNLRSLFNRNPTHLSVLAAATTRLERTALDLLPQELRTLMGMRPSISLPEMSENEAYEFVLGRFACFRFDGYSGDPTGPIGAESIRATIAFIKNEANARLIPRTLLQALSWIFDEINEEGSAISADQTRELLRQLSWEAIGEGPHA